MRINAGAQEIVQVLASGGVKVWLPEASSWVTSSRAPL